MTLWMILSKMDHNIQTCGVHASSGAHWHQSKKNGTYQMLRNSDIHLNISMVSSFSLLFANNIIHNENGWIKLEKNAKWKYFLYWPQTFGPHCMLLLPSFASPLQWQWIQCAYVLFSICSSPVFTYCTSWHLFVIFCVTPELVCLCIPIVSLWLSFFVCFLHLCVLSHFLVSSFILFVPLLSTLYSFDIGYELFLLEVPHQCSVYCYGPWIRLCD